MLNKTNYRIYERFVINSSVENYDLILGDFSPRIKSWKYEDMDELRIDFNVTQIRLIKIKGEGTQNQCMKNKPIKLFEEYQDKRGTIRLRKVENSMTKEDGSYSFDVLVDKRYFPKYYTVLIEI